MDGRRFDAMTRAFGQRLSRREAVRRASAIALAGMAITSKSVAPSHVQAAGTQGCEQPKTIRLWINSFVPNDLNSTVEVPSGDFKGQTGQSFEVQDPRGHTKWMRVVSLDDQRGHSNLAEAQSRMHSAVTFDIETKAIVEETHRFDQTIAVRIDSGEVVCGPSAGGRTRMMKFGPPVEKSAGIFEIEIEGKASFVCADAGSRTADYVGTFTIDLSSEGELGKVTFEGKVDDYPAYEAYVSVNDDPKGRELFGRYPEPGMTGIDGLPGDATIPVSGEAEIGCAPCSFVWASAGGKTSFDCTIPDTPCSGCVDGQCVSAYTYECSNFMFCYANNFPIYGTFDVCLRQAN